jgi:hypothetical protein
MSGRVLQTSRGANVLNPAPAPRIGARKSRNAALKQGIREAQDLLIEQIRREQVLDSLETQADNTLARKYRIGEQS